MNIMHIALIYDGYSEIGAHALYEIENSCLSEAAKKSVFIVPATKA